MLRTIALIIAAFALAVLGWWVATQTDLLARLRPADSPVAGQSAPPAATEPEIAPDQSAPAETLPPVPTPQDPPLPPETGSAAAIEVERIAEAAIAAADARAEAEAAARAKAEAAEAAADLIAQEISPFLSEASFDPDVISARLDKITTDPQAPPLVARKLAERRTQIAGLLDEARADAERRSEAVSRANAAAEAAQEAREAASTAPEPRAGGEATAESTPDTAPAPVGTRPPISPRIDAAFYIARIQELL